MWTLRAFPYSSSTAGRGLGSQALPCMGVSYRGMLLNTRGTYGRQRRPRTTSSASIRADYTPTPTLDWCGSEAA